MSNIDVRYAVSQLERTVKCNAFLAKEWKQEYRHQCKVFTKLPTIQTIWDGHASSPIIACESCANNMRWILLV